MVLDASYNDLDDQKDVCQTLRNWLYLREAKFKGNPISTKHRYREDIIANTFHLGKYKDEIVELLELYV